MSRIATLLVALALLASACGGGSDAPSADPAADATATALAALETDEIEPTPTPTEAVTEGSDEDAAAAEPTPEPTQVPVAELTDDQRIAGALDALDAKGAASLVAWDVLESSVLDGGQVELLLCGWEGDSVFDSVYRSRWNVQPTDTGDIEATEQSTSLHSGDCLNTELVDSAIATVQAYDALWSSILVDPTTAGTSLEDSGLLAPNELQGTLATVQTWIDDGVNFRGSAHANTVPESLAEALLIRRLSGGDGGFVEFATCREQDPEYGLYVSDVLVDRGQPAEPGPHEVLAYRLVPDVAAPHGWLVENVAGLAWANCGSGEDWPVAASRWRSEAVDFEALP